jgi:hypothetical protein
MSGITMVLGGGGGGGSGGGGGGAHGLDVQFELGPCQNPPVVVHC